MAKENTEKSGLRKHVAWTKEWHDDVLCFIFHGASKKAIEDIFRSLKAVCNSSVTTEDVHGMTNGRCHRNIVVRISKTDTHIQEDELTDMVVHFLQKQNCEVAYIQDREKFLNA